MAHQQQPLDETQQKLRIQLAVEVPPGVTVNFSGSLDVSAFDVFSRTPPAHTQLRTQQQPYPGGYPAISFGHSDSDFGSNPNVGVYLTRPMFGPPSSSSLMLSQNQALPVTPIPPPLPSQLEQRSSNGASPMMSQFSSSPSQNQHY